VPWRASGHAVNRYYLGVSIDVGINIVLAVSLNLINGTPASSASAMRLHGRRRLTRPCSPSSATHPIAGLRQPHGSWRSSLASLLAGGLLAALAGSLVGIPSFGSAAITSPSSPGLRRNHPRLLPNLRTRRRGSRGLKGIPNTPPSSGPTALAAVTVYVVAPW
jgi:branched-chain amino acid transport system permease protein